MEGHDENHAPHLRGYYGSGGGERIPVSEYSGRMDRSFGPVFYYADDGAYALYADFDDHGSVYGSYDCPAFL